ncbi:HAD family hydrolase [Roseobacter sp. HKCCA0434]|uniref:HAD family hydrolase n=1 Tax=Roseobacter sp. HKCCA0434 TaxID=3079297 RepID=UPI002905F6B8|nr:HAD family hydrolase [Roseobacter sp. HKCCA0434]
MPQTLIFDKDGTLIGFQETWGPYTRDALTDLATPQAPASVLAETIGFDMQTGRYAPESPAIAGTTADVAALLATRDPRSAAEIEALLNARPVRAQPVAPLAPLLDELIAAGHRLAVMTNDAEAPARRQLAEMGVLARFEMVVGYDSGHGAKPHPAPLLAIAEALGTSPGDCTMIGDSTHDLDAARAAGMMGVGVLSGPATAADLAAADAILPDITHLPDWLASRIGSTPQAARPTPR